MIDTLNYEFDNSVICSDLTRLINQIWKLLPMREHQEDWRKQLDSVTLELRGLHKLFGGQLNFLILITKLLGLQEEENFMTYRIQVFNIISLLSGLMKQLHND